MGEKKKKEEEEEEEEEEEASKINDVKFMAHVNYSIIPRQSTDLFFYVFLVFRMSREI